MKYFIDFLFNWCAIPTSSFLKNKYYTLIYLIIIYLHIYLCRLTYNSSSL